MSRYWFVRHGESEANAGGWLAGHRDVGLTPRGVAQARALRPALARVSPDRAVTSDLRRAVATAEIAWDGRGPVVQRAVEARERHLGAWEGESIERLQLGGGMNVLLSWDQGPPGGESHLALSRRALSLLAALDDGADLLLFGHGGWIRCVVGLVDGIPTDLVGRYKVGNAEVVEREVPRGRWAELRAALGAR